MECKSCPDTKHYRPQLLDGLCESCYTRTYIQPLIKERENSQRIVDSLTSQIKEFSTKLNLAKARVDTRTTTDELAIKMRERQRMVQRGDIRALSFVYCQNCYAPFESTIQCTIHEQTCVVMRPRSAKRASEPSVKRTAKQAKPVVEAQTIERLD